MPAPPASIILKQLEESADLSGNIIFGTPHIHVNSQGKDYQIRTYHLEPHVNAPSWATSPFQRLLTTKELNEIDKHGIACWVDGQSNMLEFYDKTTGGLVKLSKEVVLECLKVVHDNHDTNWIQFAMARHQSDSVNEVMRAPNGKSSSALLVQIIPLVQVRHDQALYHMESIAELERHTIDERNVDRNSYRASVLLSDERLRLGDESLPPGWRAAPAHQTAPVHAITDDRHGPLTLINNVDQPPPCYAPPLPGESLVEGSASSKPSSSINKMANAPMLSLPVTEIVPKVKAVDIQAIAMTSPAITANPPDNSVNNLVVASTSPQDPPIRVKAPPPCKKTLKKAEMEELRRLESRPA